MKNNSGRLRWQCRRGIKELDILLEKYLDNCFEKTTESEQTDFRELLEFEDHALISFLLADSIPVNDGVARIVKKIKTLQ